jgi:hypothetical protein
MARRNFARLLMSFVLLGSSIASFLLDWRPNHLLNPLWHPHARFHGALLLFFLAGISLCATWLLWRKSLEPDLAFNVAALISIFYWTPLFYVPYVLPSASWWAGLPGHEPRIGEHIVYPNLVFAAVMLLLTGVAWGMSRKAETARAAGA